MLKCEVLALKTDSPDREGDFFIFYFSSEFFKMGVDFEGSAVAEQLPVLRKFSCCAYIHWHVFPKCVI